MWKHRKSQKREIWVRKNFRVGNDVALQVERSADKESRIHSVLWYGRTTQTVEQILAWKFEDSSEYGTKEERIGAEQKTISVQDIELPDVDEFHMACVRKLLTEFKGMWQAQLGEVRRQST